MCHYNVMAATQPYSTLPIQVIQLSSAGKLLQQQLCPVNYAQSRPPPTGRFL